MKAVPALWACHRHPPRCIWLYLAIASHPHSRLRTPSILSATVQQEFTSLHRVLQDAELASSRRVARNQPLMASSLPQDRAAGSDSPIPHISSPPQVDIGSSSKEAAFSENSHLSYPAFDEPQSSVASAPDETRSVLRDRLYVGNLHPSVNEYVTIDFYS